MGWKGTMRSVAAAARRMEKEAERRRKAQLKVQIASDAAADVENWERYIADIVSVHCDQTKRINWQKMFDKAQPAEPKKTDKFESEIKKKLALLKPSIFDFLSGGFAKRESNLLTALNEAIKKDEIVNNERYAIFQKEFKEWEDDRKLAGKLLKGDSEAYREVIGEMQTMSQNDLIGSVVNFEINDNVIHASPLVHSDEIIPNFRRKQLASGKLSETKMPVSQFNELYQDYVASVSLKVAGDLFQMLPIDEVFVTCKAEMLNTSTGHKEPMSILSVQFVRQTFEALNLTQLDPSDAMRNFNSRSKFSKTKGFSNIEPLVTV